MMVYSLREKMQNEELILKQGKMNLLNSFTLYMYMYYFQREVDFEITFFPSRMKNL